MSFKELEVTFKENYCLAKLEKLNENIISDLIALVRTIKQTSTNTVILHFTGNEILFEHDTYDRRLNWSKLGQTLTNLIDSSSVPFVALVENPISDEFSELATSCLKVFSAPEGKIEFSTNESIYAPRWGSLDRLKRHVSETDIKRIYTSDASKIWEKYLASLDIERATSFEECFTGATNFSQSGIAFKLSCYHLSPRPGNKNSHNYVETTSYLATFENEYFSNINYLPIEKFEESLMKGKITDSLDDFGNDFMDFKDYPTLEKKLLDRKSRLEEVQRIIDNPDMGIKGKCIELGSGYGYFAMLMSKKADVTEAVAFDISIAEITRFGPHIKEIIKPNYEKFTYKIGDMNKMDSEYGTYDSVIFCASLHHSSDIPKSLEIAYKILKPGGTCVLHGEHYKPVFLSPKPLGSPIPETMIEFKDAMRTAGFKPKVFKYALRGRRLYWLKKILFEVWPFNFFNGWFRVANYLVYGIK